MENPKPYFWKFPCTKCITLFSFGQRRGQETTDIRLIDSFIAGSIIFLIRICCYNTQSKELHINVKR